MNNKTKDILIIFCLIAVAILYSISTKNLFIGRSLFSGAVLTLLPVIYMGFREKKNWKKLLLGSLIFGLLFGFALSFYAEATQSWNTNDYIFNFRFFGLNTLEEVIGHGLMALMTFTFYEHFLENKKVDKISKRYVYAVIAGIIGTTSLIVIHFLSPQVFELIKYPYLLIAIIAIIPTIYAIIKRPTLLPKLTTTMAFFFIYWFSFQFIAVSYDYWSYYGNYIGWVEIFNISYPIEELLFWMLLYSPTIVTYYTYTINYSKEIK